VKAEEAARFAPDKSDNGVLPLAEADALALDSVAVSFVGATAASNVEASSDMEVSFAACGSIVDSLIVSFVGATAAGGGAGEHD